MTPYWLHRMYVSPGLFQYITSGGLTHVIARTSCILAAAQAKKNWKLHRGAKAKTPTQHIFTNGEGLTGSRASTPVRVGLHGKGGGTSAAPDAREMHPTTLQDCGVYEQSQ